HLPQDALRDVHAVTTPGVRRPDGTILLALLLGSWWGHEGAGAVGEAIGDGTAAVLIAGAKGLRRWLSCHEARLGVLTVRAAGGRAAGARAGELGHPRRHARTGRPPGPEAAHWPGCLGPAGSGRGCAPTPQRPAGA